jgi:hypothetical protein
VNNLLYICTMKTTQSFNAVAVLDPPLGLHLSGQGDGCPSFHREDAAPRARVKTESPPESRCRALVQEELPPEDDAAADDPPLWGNTSAVGDAPPENAPPHQRAHSADCDGFHCAQGGSGRDAAPAVVAPADETPLRTEDGGAVAEAHGHCFPPRADVFATSSTPARDSCFERAGTSLGRVQGQCKNSDG